MVLLGRFELPASPLPMECSTPELQQPDKSDWSKPARYCHSYGHYARLNSLPLVLASIIVKLEKNIAWKIHVKVETPLDQRTKTGRKTA